MKNIEYSEVWGLPVLEIFSQTESHANAKIKQNRVTNTSSAAHENHVDVFKNFCSFVPQLDRQETDGFVWPECCSNLSNFGY